MTFKVKRGRKKDSIDDVYDVGDDVIKKSNPFFMLGRGMGVTKKKQEEINKGKIKVSSPHLKMLGQGDIKNDIQSKKKKKS